MPVGRVPWEEWSSSPSIAALAPTRKGWTRRERPSTPRELAAPVRQPAVQGLGEDRHAANREPAVGEGALQPRLHELLARVHLHRRLELAVRELRQAELFPAHADEALHVAVPGCHVGVADRPVDAMAVAQVRLEIQVAPAVHLAPPNQRLPADLVPLNPGERLVLDVGIAVILNEEVLHRFVELARARLDRVLLGALRPHRQPRVAQRELPAGLVLRDVVLAVLDVATALDHQRLEPLLGELLRGPAARDAGPDYDRVVGDHAQARPIEV